MILIPTMIGGRHNSKDSLDSTEEEEDEETKYLRGIFQEMDLTLTLTLTLIGLDLSGNGPLLGGTDRWSGLVPCFAAQGPTAVPSFGSHAGHFTGSASTDDRKGKRRHMLSPITFGGF